MAGRRGEGGNRRSGGRGKAPSEDRSHQGGGGRKGRSGQGGGGPHRASQGRSSQGRARQGRASSDAQGHSTASESRGGHGHTASPRNKSRRRPGRRGDQRRGGQSGGPDWVIGVHAVKSLLAETPRRIRKLHVWSHQAQGVLDAAMAAGVAVQRDQPDVSSAESHLAQGVAALVEPFSYRPLDDLLRLTPSEPGILVALDSITDTRNLGAILRTAGFFGVKGVIIPRDRAAAVTPVTERIARGGAAIVPVAQVTNLARALAQVAEAGWTVVGTALEDVDGTLWEEDFKRPTCLVMGAEDTGLRRLVRQRCDRIISLEPDGAVQSLNVASFATLAIAEARRQQGPVGA